MNLRKLFIHFLLLAISLSIFSCDTTDPKEDDHTSLLVKFANSSSSEVTITSILVQPMGVVDESTTPQGDWSTNIITGKKIAPGESLSFTLQIPNLNWSRYRLGIDNGSGNEIMLHEQENYNETNMSITHWGSDERTVSVTIKKDASTNNYIVTGWSDWAGIEN